MSPASKRAFSTLCALEIGWKNSISNTEAETIADLVDLRTRADGLRKFMRSALRKRDDLPNTLALSREITTLCDKARALAAELRIADKEAARDGR